MPELRSQMPAEHPRDRSRRPRRAKGCGSGQVARSQREYPLFVATERG